MNIHEAHARAFDAVYEQLLEFRNIAQAFGELSEHGNESGRTWVYVVRSQAEHLADAFERLELVYRRDVAPLLRSHPLAERPASAVDPAAQDGQTWAAVCEALGSLDVPPGATS
jgi:hypothetical protein